MPVDKATGLAGSGSWISVTIFSMSMEYMLASLNAEGTMFIFAGICLLSSLFIAIWVKETKGLTDKEKKNIYDKNRSKSTPTPTLIN